MSAWRKHDTGFLRNCKVFEATSEAGPLAPLLALLILDINASEERRGTLSERESRPAFLAAQLAACGLEGVTRATVADLLDVLEASEFIARGGAGAISIPGWSESEFGIRGRAPKPKDLRACDHCGETFQPERKNHRFCSDDCRKRHHESRPKGDPDARTDASDGRKDGPDGEKEGRIDGETEVPPTPKQASVRSEASAPNGDSSAEESEAEAEDSIIDQMVPICRDAGVRMHKLPLRRTLRGFCRDGGTIQDLRDLSALGRSTKDSGGLLVHRLQDPYEWRSALADKDAAAKHRDALKRNREAVTEADHRAANGLPEDGEESPRLRAIGGGAA